MNPLRNSLHDPAREYRHQAASDEITMPRRSEIASHHVEHDTRAMINPPRMPTRTVVSAGEQQSNVILQPSSTVFQQDRRPCRQAPVTVHFTGDIATLLKADGTSKPLCQIHFSQPTFGLSSPFPIEGVVFDGCLFSGNSLDHVNCQRCKWMRCHFDQVAITHAFLTNNVFQDCTFSAVFFVGSVLKEITFDHCDLQGGNFENAQLNAVQFVDCDIATTHFLNSNVSSSQLKNTVISNSEFFNSGNGFTWDSVTRTQKRKTCPLVALLVKSNEKGVSIPQLYRRLNESTRCAPLRIAMQDGGFSCDEVNAEVKLALRHVDPTCHAQQSISIQLLDHVAGQPQQFPAICSLIDKAAQLSRVIDAVILPGGEDVPSALYGQSHRQENLNSNEDYRRAILEIALIRESARRGLPLMAICRGFQIASVYYGNTLIQDIGDHQQGIIALAPPSPRPTSGLYGSFSYRLKTAVYHHQAVHEHAAGMGYLDSVLSYQGWVMAAEPVHSASAPFIGVQFHPEFYDQNDPLARASSADAPNRSNTASSTMIKHVAVMEDLLRPECQCLLSATNTQFFDILFDAARAYWVKKRVMTRTEVKQLI